MEKYDFCSLTSFFFRFSEGRTVGGLYAGASAGNGVGASAALGGNRRSFKLTLKSNKLPLIKDVWPETAPMEGRVRKLMLEESVKKW